MKKTTWVFFFYNYGKFWSVSPEQKAELKPLFSEEWYVIRGETGQQNTTQSSST